MQTLLLLRKTRQSKQLKKDVLQWTSQCILEMRSYISMKSTGMSIRPVLDALGHCIIYKLVIEGAV